MDPLVVEMRASENQIKPEVIIDSEVSAERKKRGQNMENYSDALTSASEKYTSDEEGDLREEQLEKKFKKMVRTLERNEKTASSDVSSGFTQTTETSAGGTSTGVETSEREQSEREQDDLVRQQVDALFEESTEGSNCSKVFFLTYIIMIQKKKISWKLSSRECLEKERLRTYSTDWIKKRSKPSKSQNILKKSTLIKFSPSIWLKIYLSTTNCPLCTKM